MNSKHIALFFAILLILATSSLVFGQTTENREVGSFESISLSIHAKVYLSQDNSTSLTIKGNSEDLNDIITEVEGSTLKIKRKKTSWRWKKSFKKIEVYISSPTIKDLKISGSGNIIAQTPIKTDDANYFISGSGNLIIDDLAAENIESHISGSGDMKLKGSGVERFEIHISGSGNVNAEYLKAKDVSIRVSGSGDCKVYATDKLNARVAGSGDIYYRGKPGYVDSKSAGSGSIKSIGM